MASKVEWVLKQGTFEKKRFGHNQPGLDLTRVIHDTLKDDGALVTNDCCKYYSGITKVEFATVGTPTDGETAAIPTGAIVIEYTSDGSGYYLYLKTPDGSLLKILSNA